jgi:hypothetical protein
MLSLGARTKIGHIADRTLPEAMGADAEPPTDQTELAAGGVAARSRSTRLKDV